MGRIERWPKFACFACECVREGKPSSIGVFHSFEDMIEHVYYEVFLDRMRSMKSHTSPIIQGRLTHGKRKVHREISEYDV